MQCGEIDGVVGTGGIPCSLFLGRSNGSTTHFSMADCSPHPHQKQISMTIMPALGDRTGIATEQSSHIEQMHETTSSENSEYTGHASSPVINRSGNGVRKSTLKEPLIRETCIDQN